MLALRNTEGLAHFRNVPADCPALRGFAGYANRSAVHDPEWTGPPTYRVRYDHLAGNEKHHCETEQLRAQPWTLVPLATQAHPDPELPGVSYNDPRRRESYRLNLS